MDEHVSPDPTPTKQKKPNPSAAASQSSARMVTDSKKSQEDQTDSWPEDMQASAEPIVVEHEFKLPGPDMQESIDPAIAEQAFKPSGIKVLSDLDYPTEILDPEYFIKFGPRNLIDIHKKLNGNGIKLAIIDVYDSGSPGGFQKDHLAFRNSQKLNVKDMTSRDDKLKCKPSSHALTCAAIAAGKPFWGLHFKGKNASGGNDNIPYPGGIAPNVDITVILVKFDKSDGLDMERNSLTKALEYVRDNNFDVLSMSFGGEDKEHYFQYRVNELHRNNVVVVAAAGNQGNWTTNYPALCEHAISVGYWDTTLNIPNWSRTRNVDVFFYGEVMAPYRDGSKKFVKFASGTSVAAPGIAGLICLILECAGKDKDKFKNKEILVKILKKMTEDENGDVKHLGKEIIEACDNPYYLNFLTV